MEPEKEYIRQLNEDLMWEMTNLRPERTGLPVSIYISGRKGKHGPRIKFMTKKGNVKSELLAEMTVEENPRVISKQKIFLDKNDLDALKTWVIKNKSVLLDLYHGNIDEVDAVYRLFPKN